MALTMNRCPVCGIEIPAYNGTCGKSECSEADFKEQPEIAQIAKRVRKFYRGAKAEPGPLGWAIVAKGTTIATAPTRLDAWKKAVPT